MDAVSLKTWRKTQRERLITARLALSPAQLDSWRERIDGFIARSFPGLARSRVAFCWPVKNEYDARHLARTLRSRGALTALPAIVGVALASGPLDIPFPVSSPEVLPDAVLLPMNGWDAQGYRLGYGGGYFDRTLARLAKKPVTIGVSYELARLDSIHPQAWDIPMDYVVTERGVYRRDAQELAFLGEPDPGSGVMSSPVCYADEIKRD